MPYKLNRPPRDLAKVRCVKKKKDKNGDVHYDLVVMFDHVSGLRFIKRYIIPLLYFWILGRFRMESFTVRHCGFEGSIQDI